MRKLLLVTLVSTFLLSCSSNRQIVYFKDSVDDNFYKVDYSSFNDNNIEPGDILKIDVQTVIPEAALPYNKNSLQSSLASSVDLLKIDGYVVDENKMIHYPVLGEISVENLSENQLSSTIRQLLIFNGHLTDPHVKVRRINSKFTVLGEVRNPGTFPFYDKQLNIFQAIGYAGDLNIFGKRKNITLIREENGLRKVYKVSLNKSELLNKPYYVIKNNDVIIIEPNFSKVKSAGFIGSPSSIASLSSLLLSITLLIINR